MIILKPGMKSGWIGMDDDDQPQAITLPNPPPEVVDQITSKRPVHRPDRPREPEQPKEDGKS